jgi:hypothetical protein
MSMMVRGLPVLPSSMVSLPRMPLAAKVRAASHSDRVNVLRAVCHGRSPSSDSEPKSSGRYNSYGTGVNQNDQTYEARWLSEGRQTAVTRGAFEESECCNTKAPDAMRGNYMFYHGGGETCCLSFRPVGSSKVLRYISGHPYTATEATAKDRILIRRALRVHDFMPNPRPAQPQPKPADPKPAPVKDPPAPPSQDPIEPPGPPQTRRFGIQNLRHRTILPWTTPCPDYFCPNR